MCKYFAIDIETTGLDPENCQILQFAAVYDDLRVQAPLCDLPKLNFYVKEDFYRGDPYGLAMNAEILKNIAKDEKLDFVCTNDIPWRFANWVTSALGIKPDFYTVKNPYGSIKVNVAGKNFANFDNLFLRKIPGWGTTIKVNHRIMDPSMLYFDPKLDNVLPGTEICLKRAGIEDTVTHTAMEDALLVVKLIRNKFPI